MGAVTALLYAATDQKIKVLACDSAFANLSLAIEDYVV